MIRVTPLFLAHLNAAVANAKHNAKHSPHWLRAIDRAEALLCNQVMLDYNTKTEILRYTNEAGVSYDVKEGFCPCGAHVRHCKHRAARKLIQRTLESMQMQAQTEADELFN